MKWFSWISKAIRNPAPSLSGNAPLCQQRAPCAHWAERAEGLLLSSLPLALSFFLSQWECEWSAELELSCQSTSVERQAFLWCSLFQRPEEPEFSLSPVRNTECIVFEGLCLEAKWTEWKLRVFYVWSSLCNKSQAKPGGQETTARAKRKY